MAGLVIAPASLLAQETQGQSGGNTGGNSSGSSGGNTSRGSGQTQSQGTTSSSQTDPFGQRRDPLEHQQRPLYLHGKVITSDGVPPSEPVVVQRVCIGNTFPEGYTDKKGRFSFQVGGDMSMLTSDASVGGNRMSVQGMMSGGSYTSEGIREVGLGRFDLSACVLRAELPGHRSDDVQLGMYSTMGNNDVGVIVLHRLDGVVGNVVSALTLQAPKPAAKAYESGLREMRKKNPNFNKSVAQFEKAVQAFPQFAAAWAALGDARMKLNDEAGAQVAFSKAVEADPDYLKPYEPLIRMAVARSDWATLESLGTAYLDLSPNEGNVRFLTAVAALNGGKPDLAEEMVLAMRQGDAAQRFPQSYQVMGMIHEQRADFESAASQYRSFIQASNAPESSNVQQVKRKLHEWEMLGVIEKAPAVGEAAP